MYQLFLTETLLQNQNYNQTMHIQDTSKYHISYVNGIVNTR